MELKKIKTLIIKFRFQIKSQQENSTRSNFNVSPIRKNKKNNENAEKSPIRKTKTIDFRTPDNVDTPIKTRNSSLKMDSIQKVKWLHKMKTEVKLF